MGAVSTVRGCRRGRDAQSLPQLEGEAEGENCEAEHQQRQKGREQWELSGREHVCIFYE